MPKFKFGYQKPVRIIQRPSNQIIFVVGSHCRTFCTLSNYQGLHPHYYHRAGLPSSSLLSFSSSLCCYPASGAKFGVPNGLDQSFASKLPSATGSEICARKTRMDFRFAHLRKITKITKGTNTQFFSFKFIILCFVKPNTPKKLCFAIFLQPITALVIPPIPLTTKYVPKKIILSQKQNHL